MTDWSTQPERGNATLVWLMVWIVRRLGWLAAGLLLPITAWFYFCSGEARRASRSYLTRVLGRPVGAGDVFRHMFVFARVILDSFYLLSGRTDRYDIDITGLEHVNAVIESGRGCLLLGAHLGSFDVLRRVAERAPVPVKALMFRANAGALTCVLERLDPALAACIIEIGDIHAMLRVHEAVAGGAVVGILADRCPRGGRSIPAPFFGESAAFPMGPFVLAGSLGVPVLTFHGVRTGPRRYDIRFTPFAEQVVLRRATRQADLAAYVARYAAWLETGCRAYPFNWFNFYPFWEHAEHAPTQARPASLAASATATADAGAFARSRAAAG